MDEAGPHQFYLSIWEALFAPKGTPRTVIDRLNAAAVNTLGDPSVRQKLEAQGYEIPPPKQQTPEALRAYQKAEIEKWSKRGHTRTAMALVNNQAARRVES
jgi:tripartite-type tricarboxylate transporter receptor subunit TctC